MLKYIVTTKCPNSCSYCITKNLKVNESTSLSKLEKVFRKLSKQHKEIMFTGGEPLSSKLIWDKVNLAQEYFWGVHLSTAEFRIVLNAPDCFKSITYSLHKREFPQITVCKKPNIYIGILLDEIESINIDTLLHHKYSGLTINENHREEKDNSALIEQIKAGCDQYGDNLYKYKDTDFSIKINRKGHCLDETIILPDYSITTNFERYL